MITMR